MVGDQNYLKVKKALLFFLICLFSQVSFANDIKISKIVDLEDPWGSTFINDKELIITEKIGKIKLINIETGDINEIKHNINFLVDGQGGLLDIIYKDQYVWVSYSEDRGSGKSNTQGIGALHAQQDGRDATGFRGRRPKVEASFKIRSISDDRENALAFHLQIPLQLANGCGPGLLGGAPAIHRILWSRAGG